MIWYEYKNTTYLDIINNKKLITRLLIQLWYWNGIVVLFAQHCSSFL